MIDKQCDYVVSENIELYAEWKLRIALSVNNRPSFKWMIEKNIIII